jgi:hypothetical protein
MAIKKETAAKPAETKTTATGKAAKNAKEILTKAEQIAEKLEWISSYAYAPEAPIIKHISQAKRKGSKAILEFNMRKTWREGDLYGSNGRFRKPNRDDVNQGILYVTDTGEILCKTIIGKEMQVAVLDKDGKQVMIKNKEGKLVKKTKAEIVVVGKSGDMYLAERKAYREIEIENATAKDDKVKLKKLENNPIADDYGSDIRTRICELMILTLFRKLGHLKNEMPTIKQLNALLKDNWTTGTQSGKKRINIERKFHSTFFKSSVENEAEDDQIEAAMAVEEASGWDEE